MSDEIVTTRPKPGSAHPAKASGYCKTHHTFLTEAAKQHHGCKRRRRNGRICSGYLSVRRFTPELLNTCLAYGNPIACRLVSTRSS